ncbi:MAG: SDR family NAD(P)-dependent oxidoreductase [Syntrophobacteraceae bacterium]
MKKAVIIGASSGIGRELAVILSEEGYTVGLAARRLHLLEELKNRLSGPAFNKEIDLCDPTSSMNLLEELISEMGGADLIIIAAGIGSINPDLDWAAETETIATNVTGFAAAANVAFRHFTRIGRGHLVGISSIAAIRGGRQAPAYNASKAFVSNYLEGLRNRAVKAGVPIAVTDIQPGFVDTKMLKVKRPFWVSSPREAARQIHRAIERKARRAYITKRWILVAWLFKILPASLYARL